MWVKPTRQIKGTKGLTDWIWSVWFAGSPSSWLHWNTKTQSCNYRNKKPFIYLSTFLQCLSIHFSLLWGFLTQHFVPTDPTNVQHELPNVKTNSIDVIVSDRFSGNLRARRDARLISVCCDAKKAFTPNCCHEINEDLTRSRKSGSFTHQYVMSKETLTGLFGLWIA